LFLLIFTHNLRATLLNLKYNQTRGEASYTSLTMNLTIYELLTIKRLIDEKIKLYESFLDNGQLDSFFQIQITDLQTLKTKVNERVETVLC
jgi:hypothetical protein